MRGLLWTLLAAIGLTAVLWAFLLTPLGLDTAARLTERAIKLGSGMQARIEDVSGVFPFSLHVGRFALADAEGPWLVVGDARLSWSPEALFAGRVLVRELTADVVRIRRTPHLPPMQGQPVRIEWPPQLPSRPPLLVDRLAVDHLILDKEFAGQAASIGINGKLAESGQGAVTLTLAATRQDGDKPLSLRLAGTLHFVDWHLAAKATLEDAPGGLLASTLSSPTDGPIAGPLLVSLTGDAPLNAWKGRLTATLSQKPLLTADLGLAVPLEKNAMASFSLDATASPPPGLLPEQTARALGPSPGCAIAGRMDIVSGALFLDRADFTVAAGTIAIEGSLAPEADTLVASARLSLPDASRLDPALAGELAATLSASGNLSRPHLELHLGTKNGRAGPLTLAASDITAKIELAGKLDGIFPGATVVVSGTLSDLAGPEKTTLFGEKLALSLEATLDTNGGIAAKTGSLSGTGGTLTLADLQWINGNIGGTIALDVEDVAGATSLVGLKLTGALAATADVTANATATGEATLAVRLKNLASASQADAGGTALAALLGASPKLTAKAAFSPAGVRLSELTLDGKAVALSGTGGFDAKAATLSAKATAKIPNLTVLAPALGQKCGGALEATVDLSGPADSPRIMVTATAERLGYADLALTGATFEGTLTDVIARPSGQARLTAHREGETAQVETAFAFAGSRLTVKDLRLTAPDAAFSGEAVVDTATGRVAGKITGNASNLASLGRFTGAPLAGSLKLSATAGSGRTGQTLAGELTAANLRLPGLNAAGLTVSANLDDVTGQPRGRATVSGKGLAAAGCTLSALTLEATGDGRALAFSASAKGTVTGETPLALTAKAALTGTQRGHTLTVASLSGTLGKGKFALASPAALTFGDGATRLEGLALSYDKALLTASVSLTPKETAAKASVAHFPLPMLAAFGLAGIDGTGTLTATLSGPPAKPSLAADIRLDGLRLVSEKGEGVPPIAIQANANLAGDKCNIKGSITGKGKKEAATVDATIPLHFTLDPFALELSEGGAMTGRITADSDLSDMATLLAQVNTRLVGRLTADLTLGGTLAAPTASGSLSLAAKRLENADAGIVFHNIDVHADASGGVLTINKASGEDGKGGSFALSGKLGIADPEHGPVDLSLRLTRLRVAGLDMATVTADGTLAVTGTLSRMRAAGTITLGPADINLPTSLPPDVVVIPVTLVNDPNAPATPRKKAPPAAARHIDLDIKVALGQAVYVRGLGLDSRWGGQVAVTGTAAAPIIIGKFSVEKGRIDLLGSSLDITKGEVVFLGASPPAPTIDIRGETTSNDVTAGISIIGEATNPTIALTSTPTLPHDEILSRILFGQSASTLSPIQAAQLAQAAASLYTGGTPTNILARTRRILGLDQLTLVTGKSGIATTVLRAGKEIVKGVNVGVEQGTGAQSGAVSVEVQLTPNITVDSRVGTDNKQGVGVNWKWDY